jgi:GTPase SAR1 family protein
LLEQASDPLKEEKGKVMFFKKSPYEKAEQKIKEAQRSGTTVLDLSNMGAKASEKLTELPESLCQLTQLQELYVSINQLSTLPEWLGQLTRLQVLSVGANQLTTLPDSLGQLTELEYLNLSHNQLKTLPSSLTKLTKLKTLDLDNNPLEPELAAAHKEGLESVKRYLLAKEEPQVELNEAKLILIGEGEVGKSCLLAALRGDKWEEGKPTTHGIEIRPVKVIVPETGKEITLNGWDFGGQRVYRPTHQLFFSSAAVYLVVWKPREGPQQGFVKEWIKLIKHRVPDAKILVVATHGGPKERQPDIDRQELWDLFGRETVIDFYSVENKPLGAKQERQGIAELKDAIAHLAADLPDMGRSFPKHWQAVRDELSKLSCQTAWSSRLAQNKMIVSSKNKQMKREKAYLSRKDVFAICKKHNIKEADAALLLRICRRVGDLIHYEHDPVLRDIVILKPDWLATAISYVLDDKQIRNDNGLVEFSRLSLLWNDPERPEESRYDPGLHVLFLRLMERFDLSYKVAVPSEPEDALSFWQRLGKFFDSAKNDMSQASYTSLIAQLVPNPRPDLLSVWPENPKAGDSEKVQICRIVDAKDGQSANAEGLFFQLIVRLHKYSLGRMDYNGSVHWQRGLVLDDDYNGRALLEHIGHDIHIRVRAPYPQAFLAVLTREVKWLVEDFWKGIRCDVMVPCIEPCGRNAPGTGLYNVQNLIESKRDEGVAKFPCPVCNRWQNIDELLNNAHAASPNPIDELSLNFDQVMQKLKDLSGQMDKSHVQLHTRFDNLDEAGRTLMSKIDASFNSMMLLMKDEATEGPRLFSFEPVKSGFWDKPDWVSQKFRLTLWCEHSRLPLPVLNGKNDKNGVYELELPREWLVKAAPFLKILTTTLSLVAPVASAGTKLALADTLDDAAYKSIEKQLEFGQKCLDAVSKGSEQTTNWLSSNKAADFEQGRGSALEAQGADLRRLQVWLKEKDPGFGGLVRVLNKRQEFLWVHPQFETHY